MPATSSQTLYTEATCYSCLGLVTPFETMVIGALIQANTALGVTMTPQEWLDEATCYVCLPGVSQAQAIIIAMLDSISQNISGGGGGATCGAYGGGAPTFTPSGTCAIAIDTDTGTEWFYYSGSWH